METLETAIKSTSKMTLGSLIKNYANYNLWANKTLVDWLKTKPGAVMAQEVPSSFPTIKLTLEHMLVTQQFWLKAIKKENTIEDKKNTESTLEEVYKNFVLSCEEFATYVNSLTEEQIQEICPLKTPWFESNLSRFEYIQHSITHTTYHRGQVVTIGRNVGLTDAPMTDYNFYNIMAR